MCLDKIVFLLLLFFMANACDKSSIIKDPDIDPCLTQPCDTLRLVGRLDTVWTSDISEDNALFYSNAFYLVKDQLIMVNANSTIGYVSSYSKNIGNNLWTWKEIIASTYTSGIICPDEDGIIIQQLGSLGKIDLLNGSTKKIYVQGDPPAAHSFGQIIGNHYYITIRTKNDFTATLIRSHFEDLQTWDTIYVLNRGNETGNSRPNIQSYNLWTDPETSDSILIFQHRMALPNRVDVMAWNMTKKQVEWRHDDLTKLGNSNHQQIFLHDNKAYFAGGTAFYCFDMKTGEIVWQYDHPSGVNTFMYYKIIYARDENLLYVRDGGECLHAFHPETGEIIWKIPYDGVTALGSGSPTYSKGIIYYTMDDKLWAIRASNGEVLWSEKSKLHYTSRFSGDVAIDEERGILYATDRRYLIAIKTYQE